MRRMVFNKTSLIGFIGLVLYRVLLDYVYFTIISPLYSYAGFVDYRTFGSGLASWMLFIVFYFFIRRIMYSEDDGISHVITTLLYLLSFIPFTSSVFAGFANGSFVIWNSIYWLILIIGIRYIMRLPKDRLPAIKLDQISFSDGFVTAVGVLSLLVVIYVSGRYTNFRLNFNLFTVYDLRLEAREFGMSTLAAYLFAWTKAVNTLMLAYCLIRKRHVMTVVFFTVQMLSFGIDGSKSTFFLPFLVLLVVKVYDRISVGKLKMLFIYGASVGMLLAAAEYVFVHTFFLTTIFIRRVLYIPSILNTQYYDFFTTHEPDFFRGSFLRLLGMKSPYASMGGISRMIGSVYYGSSVMNCNNGLLSDAISNLGYVGTFVMPVLIVASLRLFDRSTAGLDKRLVLVSGVFIALNLISTSFMIVLITHGFLLLIILTWLMKPEDLYYSNKLAGGGSNG